MRRPRARRKEDEKRTRTGDQRDNSNRRGDQITFWMDILIIVLIGAMTAWFYTYSHDKSTQRTGDLRAQCRKGSQKTAADINLNWVDYQTEHLLATPTIQPKQILGALSVFPPPERRFFLLLLEPPKGKGKHHPPNAEFVLRVRANADFDAAFAKARTVDYRDVRFIADKTPLGSEIQVRAWVLKAHFSCDQAFK